MNFFEYLHKRIEKNTSGFTLHYATLYSIVHGLEAKKVFEFGSGFSSEVILQALDQTNGKLITCDRRAQTIVGHNPELIENNKGRWVYLQANSQDKSIKEKIKQDLFDLVLHDGAHDFWTVIKDIRMIVPHIKQNGLLLIHDTYHPTIKFMRLAIKIGLGLRSYELVTLPYGYGLTIVRIKGNHKKGKINTTWQKNK